MHRFLQVSLWICLGRIGPRKWFTIEKICFGHIDKRTLQQLARLLQIFSASDHARKVQDLTVNAIAEKLIHRFVAEHPQAPTLTPDGSGSIWPSSRRAFFISRSSFLI